MSNRNYKAVAYEIVTHHPAIKNRKCPWDDRPAYDTREIRYRIEDINTGVILDDAQGYGYKTARNAYAGYSYKSQSKKAKREKSARAVKIKKWFSAHEAFTKELEAVSFEIAKDAMCGGSEKFTTKTLKSMLDTWGLEVDFPLNEMLKVFQKL